MPGNENACMGWFVSSRGFIRGLISYHMVCHMCSVPLDQNPGTMSGSEFCPGAGLGSRLGNPILGECSTSGISRDQARSFTVSTHRQSHLLKNMEHMMSSKSFTCSKSNSQVLEGDLHGKLDADKSSHVWSISKRLFEGCSSLTDASRGGGSEATTLYNRMGGNTDAGSVVQHSAKLRHLMAVQEFGREFSSSSLGRQPLTPQEHLSSKEQQEPQ